MSAPTPRVNYLNNRDILKEIHLSKNSYCVFRDRVTDHQYDIILPSLDHITAETIQAAKEERASRFKRETGTAVDPNTITNQDLVFRITSWAHIPLAPKKVPKVQQKKKKIEDYFDSNDIEDMGLDHNDGLDELLDEPILDPTHIRLNFPPFDQYRLDDNNQPFIVGRSHWKGTLEQGEFSKDHGQMTRKLAMMFMKLCERYGTRSNWRGYCVDQDTQALTNCGWLGINDITPSDIILSYDGSHLQWSKILSVFRDQYNGLMHKLTSKGMDALITPGHKLVTDKGLVKVEHLLHTDKVMLMGKPVPSPAEKYSNSFVELVSWVVTNGSYSADNKTVTISQVKRKHVDRLRECINNAGIQCSEKADTRNTLQFSLDHSSSLNIVEKFPLRKLTMEFISEISPQQRNSLITSLSGSRYKLQNTHDVDMFQALCALAGKNTSAYSKENTVSIFSRSYTRGLTVDFNGGYVNSNSAVDKSKQFHPNQPTEHYQGMVWCPETEYGSFVARRNGKVYLTGNTYNEEMRGQALLQLSQIGLQFDESKSQNPFAYYTAAITNSFTRVLNIEKKNQNIRDDILEINNLNPSFTRQMSGSGSHNYDE